MTDAYDEPIDAPAGHYWDIELIATELRDAREDWRNAHKRHAELGAAGFPSRQVIDKIMIALCGALFPLRLGPSCRPLISLTVETYNSLVVKNCPLAARIKTSLCKR